MNTTAYSHPVSGEVAILDREQFLSLFEKEVRPAIIERLQRTDVAGVCCYENIDMCSSRLGHRTAMIFGPGCTYKTPEQAAAGRLGDVPSVFQYPRHIHLKPVTP